MKARISALLLCGCFWWNTIAQTTYNRVYQILQTKCATSCHNSTNPSGNLLLNGSPSDVLSRLVDVTPQNTAAASRGLKYVYPGNARKSFLFLKINQGLDGHVSLQPGEGTAMPMGQPPLSLVEREMIRQWIIFGAADTGYAYANEQVITNYYNGFAEHRDPSLPIPNPSEGFQLYFGPIFLMPGEEVEFDGKFEIGNTFNAEVYKMDVAMNKESHHLAVYKYHSGNGASVAPGLKKVNSLLDAVDLFFAADVIAQWPNSLEVELPQGTGLFWDSNTVLNLSYHILNYSDSIIAAEVYMNIYARPRQPHTIEMTSYPVRYDGHPQYQGGWDVFNLVILPTGTDTTFTINQWHADSAFYWNIWSIQAHTHQLGKDYNVWLRNSDGSKGLQIYNGKYDVTHTFNQGFYDWEHPPLRYFDPPLPVDMAKGLIHEAVFNNPTGDTVTFGLKTTDEMFVTYIFYYKTPYTMNVDDSKTSNDVHIKLFPNPTSDKIYVQVGSEVRLHHATISIYDLLGNKVLVAEPHTHGMFEIETHSLGAGQYFYHVINDGVLSTKGKFLKK